MNANLNSADAFSSKKDHLHKRDQIVGTSIVDRRSEVPEWLSEVFESSRKRPYSCMANICHHLGQPATVIAVSIALLQRQLENADAETLSLLENISSASQHIDSMLHDMQRSCAAGVCIFAPHEDHDSPA
ncbi:MAG TPA: hypothetical protein PKE55_05205 [Kiritimatiellia bacterium]|nr:hypothetical protein [Kiritimatiellia bacterium]